MDEIVKLIDEFASSIETHWGEVCDGISRYKETDAEKKREEAKQRLIDAIKAKVG